jgi:hypothetical protein
MLQAALDFLDHLGIGLLHVGNALDDLDLLLRGQTDEDFAGFLRGEMSQNQRDCLGMLILNESEKVFAFSFLQEGEGRGLDLLGDLFDHTLCVVFGEGFLQQRFGVFEAALTDIGVGQGKVVELIEDIAALIGGDFAKRGDLARHFLDGFGGKTLENLRGAVLIERNQKNGCFLYTR